MNTKTKKIKAGAFAVAMLFLAMTAATTVNATRGNVIPVPGGVFELIPQQNGQSVQISDEGGSPNPDDPTIPVIVVEEWGGEDQNISEPGFTGMLFHRYYKRTVRNYVGMELFSLKADGWFKSDFHKIISVNDGLTLPYANGFFGYSYTNFQKDDQGVGTPTATVLATARFHWYIGPIEIRYWDASVWVTCTRLGQSTHGSDGWDL